MGVEGCPPLAPWSAVSTAIARLGSPSCGSTPDSLPPATVARRSTCGDAECCGASLSSRSLAPPPGRESSGPQFHRLQQLPRWLGLGLEDRAGEWWGCVEPLCHMPSLAHDATPPAAARPHPHQLFTELTRLTDSGDLGNMLSYVLRCYLLRDQTETATWLLHSPGG